MKQLSLALATICLALCATTGLAQQIQGDYVETRNLDVFVGQCYANAEVGLAGNQAIMAWHITKGEWNGVKLDDMHVAAVVKAADTLGYQFTNPYPAKTILIVDEKATAAQRTALTAFVQAMGGRMTEDIVKTETAPMSLQLEYDGEHPSVARLQAGKLAAITTRPLTGKDKICGHEETLFKPLTPVGHVMAAVATLDQFTGKGLNANWSLSGKRSAFIGHFAK